MLNPGLKPLARAVPPTAWAPEWFSFADSRSLGRSGFRSAEGSRKDFVMTDKQRSEPTMDIDAVFPAACIPALAPFQGTGDFEGPDPQRNYRGIHIQKHPSLEGRVELTATDGSNVLCLTPEGHFSGDGFVFELTDEMVEVCRRKAPMDMCAADWAYKVDLPAWMQPGRVLMLGNRAPFEPMMQHLSAYVGTKEPMPENKELGLGAFQLKFGDRTSVFPASKMKFPTGKPERERHAPARAFSLLAPVVEALDISEVEVMHGPDMFLWILGDHGFAFTACMAEKDSEPDESP